METTTIDEIFRRFSKANSDPKTELDYTNAYTLLVAVVLSAQSTDVGVNKATKDLFKVVQTPEDMLRLGEVGLKSYVKTIGLFNTKAKNIIALSKDLVAKHQGEIPHDREALEGLPGVGRKTANIILNIVWGEQTIAVDTHVFRVANRIGLVVGNTVREVEDGLLKVIPQKWRRHAHHWLILHGRYVCKARVPLCATCLIQDLCVYAANNKGSSQKKTAAGKTHRRL